jgi:hypothetical protein
LVIFFQETLNPLISRANEVLIGKTMIRLMWHR